MTEYFQIYNIWHGSPRIVRILRRQYYGNTIGGSIHLYDNAGMQVPVCTTSALSCRGFFHNLPRLALHAFLFTFVLMVAP